MQAAQAAQALAESKSARLQSEADLLTTQNARLVGHQNSRQKIQYVAKIKVLFCCCVVLQRVDVVSGGERQATTGKRQLGARVAYIARSWSK